MNVYEMVNNKILAVMEQGRIPWQMPWIVSSGKKYVGAYNAVSGISYSLINQILLGKPGKWATFKQWKENGGKIKKGAKSSQVIFWHMYEKEVKDENGKLDKKRIPVLKYYNVFHVDDIENIDKTKSIFQEHEPEIRKAFKPEEEAEGIINEYLNREKIEFYQDGKPEAYYSPSRDMIHIPNDNLFKKSNGFYSTIFHEMGHSTGHKKRLDRDMTGLFGSPSYAREELIAEMTSSYLLNLTGLDDESAIRNNTAYLQSWMECIKKDEKCFITACSRAEKAVAYILNENQEDNSEN